MAVVIASNLRKELAGDLLFDGVSFKVERRDRHYTWAVAADPEDPGRWWVSASTGPYAAHGHRDPQARIYEWRGDVWHAVTENLSAMPYAFVRENGRLIAGLADGSLLDVESGESRALGLGRIAALAPAG